MLNKVGREIPEEILKITNNEKLQIMLEHINLEVKEKGENVAIKEMRKHITQHRVRSKGVRREHRIMSGLKGSQLDCGVWKRDGSSVFVAHTNGTEGGDSVRRRRRFRIHSQRMTLSPAYRRL